MSRWRRDTSMRVFIQSHSIATIQLIRTRTRTSIRIRINSASVCRHLANKTIKDIKRCGCHSFGWTSTPPTVATSDQICWKYIKKKNKTKQKPKTETPNCIKIIIIKWEKEWREKQNGDLTQMLQTRYEKSCQTLRLHLSIGLSPPPSSSSTISLTGWQGLHVLAASLSLARLHCTLHCGCITSNELHSMGRQIISNQWAWGSSENTVISDCANAPDVCNTVWKKPNSWD